MQLGITAPSSPLNSMLRFMLSTTVGSMSLASTTTLSSCADERHRHQYIMPNISKPSPQPHHAPWGPRALKPPSHLRVMPSGIRRFISIGRCVMMDHRTSLAYRMARSPEAARPSRILTLLPYFSCGNAKGRGGGGGGGGGSLGAIGRYCR